jgi:hypothetical protein
MLVPAKPGQVWEVGISHDVGCAALRLGLRACDCEIVQIRAERAA